MDQNLHQTGLIVLAAGLSKRMGQLKMLTEFKGRNLIDIAIETSKNLDLKRCVFVTGHESNLIENSLNKDQVPFVKNTNFQTGMMSSIQCGIKNLQDTCSAMVVHLGDMPLITSSDISLLIDSAQKSGKGLARFIFQGTPGHPVYIDKKYWDEILTQPLVDIGCRFLFKKYKDDLLEIDAKNVGVIFDVDKKEDLR